VVFKGTIGGIRPATVSAVSFDDDLREWRYDLIFDPSYIAVDGFDPRCTDLSSRCIHKRILLKGQ
jgi:hypothetical protein